MMLFKLSLKNIKKSMKDYAIYFFTLVLGVSIFYVFNAIDSQTVMLNVTASTREIIDLMTNMLSGVSVFVSFILGFLIIYASSFLIKRRNKEFGIYLTLGMSKRKISLILFFETLLIGFISLVVGLGLGFCLSQFMSILVANMFDADMTKFEFIFSSSACMKTLIYFGIMYILVMIFNTFNISKCKLIDLIHANKKSEKVKLKNPILCILIFIISATMLGYAYYLVTGGISQLDSSDKIFIPIGLGIVSTFFIFWSLSGLVLKVVMSMKNVYYKGLNSFTLRQVSSKINTTVFSMTIISLMLFVTICVLSSCLSLKNSMQGNIKKLTPVDVEFAKELNIDDSKTSLKDTLKNSGISINDTFKDILEVNMYGSSDLTLKESFGDAFLELQKNFPRLDYAALEDIMTISDYNKIAKKYGKETYKLNDDQYMIIADFDSLISLRNISLRNNQVITVNNEQLKPRYDECKDGFVNISANHINSGIVIVPDHIVNNSMIKNNIIVANYKTTDKDEQNKINEEITNLWNDNWKYSTSMVYESKINIVEASVGLGALVTFIGLYLGIIFLISSAAILALKELSESSDNKERFKMLRKLGVDEKMLNRALFRQIGIFFLFPLLLAIIHSYFGISFANYMLQTFGTDQLLPSIIMTALFLIIIYGGYFIITYICSKNIIKGR